ncbi:MAG: hypothetical protein R2861_04375 [Desulfobacterales bacterium]
MNGQLQVKFNNGISANFSAHYKDVTEWRFLPVVCPGRGHHGRRPIATSSMPTCAWGMPLIAMATQQRWGLPRFNVFNTTLDDTFEHIGSGKTDYGQFFSFNFDGFVKSQKFCCCILAASTYAKYASLLGICAPLNS